MATLSIPHSFVAGTPALASEVNANFQAVVSWTQGQISTDNLGILGARSVALPSSPTFAILSLSQTASQIALNISNSGTESALAISQSGALANGKGAILINSPSNQTTSGAAELLMTLNTNSSIPAILVKHGAVETMSATKDELDLFASAVEISAARVKLPVRTAAQRNTVTQEGSVVYNTDTDQLNVRRSDAWVPVEVPVGSMQMYAGIVAPEGWLLCGDVTLDSVANPQYAKLFAVIGTTYGGTGASNFKLPDTRGRTAIGVGTGTGLTIRALADTGGAETHLLTSTESGQKAVTTNISTGLSKQMDSEEAGSGNNRFIVGNGGEFQGTLDWNHTHSIAGSSAASAHNNMQPFIALNYIIKY